MSPEVADVEVFTALLADVEDTGRPTVPIICVQVIEPIYRVTLDRPPEDVFRVFSLDMGMKVLANPFDVLMVDMPDWLVVCTPREGVVIDSEGKPWATGVAPFSMWNDVARDRGGRVGVLYTPGMFEPGTNMGDNINGDVRRLARLAGRGQLIGGMATLKTVADLPPELGRPV